MTRRPIDPPDIPAWRRAEARSEDETPTLTSLPGSDVADSEETQWDAVPPSDTLADAWGAAAAAGVPDLGPEATAPPPDAPEGEKSEVAKLAPQPLGEPPEDPRELAKRLAAEAKAKIAAASSQPGPERAEDPRELAKRLAAEAKARVARTPAPARRQEDPRELAKRLAAEAKARTTRTPAPAARTDDPSEVGQKMAAEARNRAQVTEPPTPSYTPPAAPAPKPSGHTTSEPSPARRKPAPPAKSRSRSAKEILEAALRSEQVTAPPEPSPVPQPTTPPPAPSDEGTAQASVVEPSPVPSNPPAAAATDGNTTWEPQSSPAARPVASPAAVLLEMLPGAEVEAPVAVERPDVFKAVWRAHRTRALHERDFAGVAMASALIDASTRVAEGSLVGARVILDGKPHAVFADVERKALLAVFHPADVYLAGLGAT